MIFTLGMVAFLIAALLHRLFNDPVQLMINPASRAIMVLSFAIGVIGIAAMAVSLGILAWRHLP